jgi:hypothetical protein
MLIKHKKNTLIQVDNYIKLKQNTPINIS